VRCVTGRPDSSAGIRFRGLIEAKTQFLVLVRPSRRVRRNGRPRDSSACGRLERAGVGFACALQSHRWTCFISRPTGRPIDRDPGLMALINVDLRPSSVSLQGARRSMGWTVNSPSMQGRRPSAHLRRTSPLEAIKIIRGVQGGRMNCRARHALAQSLGCSCAVLHFTEVYGRRGRRSTAWWRGPPGGGAFAVCGAGPALPGTQIANSSMSTDVIEAWSRPATKWRCMRAR